MVLILVLRNLTDPFRLKPDLDSDTGFLVNLNPDSGFDNHILLAKDCIKFLLKFPLRTSRLQQKLGKDL